ncbi:hypothetical protein WN943_018582 [Citrus x changshan-huyou]
MSLIVLISILCFSFLCSSIRNYIKYGSQLGTEWNSTVASYRTRSSANCQYCQKQQASLLVFYFIILFQKSKMARLKQAKEKTEKEVALRFQVEADFERKVPGASDRFIILCLKSSDDSQITEFLFSFSFLKVDGGIFLRNTPPKIGVCRFKRRAHAYLVVSLLELPQHSSHGRKSRAEKNFIIRICKKKKNGSLSDNRVTPPARETQLRTILYSLSNLGISESR